MKATISISDVLELNDSLASKGASVRVHLRDACGGQSCWLEPLGEGSSPEAARELIREHFAARRMTLTFSEDGLSFWPTT